MSLVGSLEDLGLGDILQIVSLSRKSGLLLIHSDEGEGRIIFCDGLVRAAFVKGQPEDLRGLLVQSGFVPEADFQRAVETAEARGEPVDVLVPECSSLSKERLDSLRREHVERAVFRIFSFQGGEFSFEVRDDVDVRDREILLPVGVNAQYLTMEATRLGDEDERADDDDAPMFSGEGDDESFGAEPSAAADVVALASAREVGPDLESPTIEMASPIASTDPAEAAPEGPIAECLIALDSQLGSLEWQKATLSDCFGRVHIFQSVERAIERIRQYLVRGRVPIVLLSGTPPSDAPDLDDLIRRLKQLAPSLSILMAVEEGADLPLASSAADAVVRRPAAALLDSRRAWPMVEEAAEAFREEISTWLATLGGRPAGSAAPSSAAATDPDTSRSAPSAQSEEGLRRLREMSERIRDPERRGEALSLVLEFASESFSRVAIFMVRDDLAVGMAQRGLEPGFHGPMGDDLRRIELPVGAVDCFARVLESRTAWHGAIGEGDQPLISRLGVEVPAEAYLAPIESSGRVVALLYADTLPESRPIPDTTILEIVLHEAGLALERALLERSLARVADSEGA